MNWTTNACYLNEGTTLINKAYMKITDTTTGATYEHVYACDPTLAAAYDGTTCSDADVVTLVKDTLGPAAVATEEGKASLVLRIFP